MTLAISPEHRRHHEQWLTELTQLPTAAGKEQRVIAWLKKYLKPRPELTLDADAAGNLTIRFTVPAPPGRPIYFTAHMDHPAFVVERVEGNVIEASFRGGVMDDYFPGTPVTIHAQDGPVETKIRVPEGVKPAGPFKHYLLDAAAGAERVRVGDVATWTLPPAEVIDGNMHTHACDDLAALAAAVSAMDVLRTAWGNFPPVDVRLLLTRAEEIGFIGAIAACREGTIPRDARVIALENSRSFAESPIGGGPIVRVGDRMSVFSPSLTDAVAKRAEEIAGGPADVRASQKASEAPRWKWQRKLMAGGACEASVFCHSGYEATCVCLPLGNYHNMGDLAAVQAGTHTRPPTIEREFISLADYHGLIDLLVACAEKLPAGGAQVDAFQRLWNERSFVL